MCKKTNNRWKIVPYGCKKHQLFWIDGNPINKGAERQRAKREIEKERMESEGVKIIRFS